MEQADRSHPQADPVTVLDPTTLHHIVTLRLGGETLALPVEQVGQILPMLAITPLPDSAGAVLDSVLGVINLHGEIVPVVDMACHFGLPPAAPERDTPVVVTRAGGLTFGLVVDEVIDVQAVRPIDVTPSQQALPASLGAVPALAGMVRAPRAPTGHMTLLLDANHLLDPEQRQALARALELLREQAPGTRAGVS